MQFARKFAFRSRIGRLAGFFALFAVVINILGLFGLASYVAEQRTREMGIRKVVGASVFSLWKLLSKGFVIMVVVSCCVGLPVAYYFMHGWLQQNEYRTGIAWWVLAVSGVTTLLIALSTISYQSLRVARINPVKCLRME